MVVRKTVLAVLLITLAGCSASPSRGVGPWAGPSAQQLAHGHWIQIPAAPIALCDPLPVWDGRDLVVVEAGLSWCPRAAAAYNPRANRWTTIAAPPRVISAIPSRKFSQEPVAAWGGGQLMLVSPVTGVTVTWSPATGQWHRTAAVPSAGTVSVGWTGSRFLVITARMIAVNTGVAQAFALSGGRWTRLPDLPQPGRGRIVDAATATDDGVVYALAEINVVHTDPNDMFTSGHVNLLRLTAAGWTRLPVDPGAPRSQLALTPVAGAILATGSGCPGICMEEDGAVALLRPGASHSTIPLQPKAGVPYPSGIAAGGPAVVVTYANGIGGPPRPAADEPAPGLTEIYDITTGSWLKGPTAAISRSSPGTYFGADWTPYGVMSIGRARSAIGGESGYFGGWLLRPAKAW
jgi:hypothetical protein